MKAPKLVRDWCREGDLDLTQFAYEAEGDGVWEKVSEELIGEDKYNNTNEVIFKHLPTGRFFRCYTNTLPYGISDYEMAPEDDNDIEEVYPRQVMVTVYRTSRPKVKA